MGFAPTSICERGTFDQLQLPRVYHELYVLMKEIDAGLKTLSPEFEEYFLSHEEEYEKQSK